MDFQEMDEAITDARITINKSNRYMHVMAKLLVGNLRSCNVSACDLVKLKKELKGFNMHTEQWKDK